MHVCMYVCIYIRMYIHTYCVLIKPPMPYIASSPLCLLRVCASKKTYFTNEDILFITSLSLCLLRVFTSYLNFGSWERVPRVPPCKPLYLVCFFIYDANYFMIFFKKNFTSLSPEIFFLFMMIITSQFKKKIKTFL
jgi:hypothetical protein